MGRKQTEFKLTLDDVLTTCNRLFRNSNMLMNDFLCGVKEIPEGSAAIGPDGYMYYCPQWCAEWLTTPGRMDNLIAHELGHAIIGDMGRLEDHGASELANFVSDAIINALMFHTYISTGELDIAQYPEDGIGCLLRVGAKPKSKELIEIYTKLYPMGEQQIPSVQLPSVPELMQMIVIRFPDSAKKMGSSCQHGKDHVPKGSLPQNVQDAVKKGLLEAMLETVREHGGSSAGQGGSLGALKVEIENSTLTIREQLLREYSEQGAVRKLKQYFTTQRKVRSVVPFQLGRKQALMLAAGVVPQFYDVTRSSKHQKNQDITVYLDVSGSVHSYLPKILGVLRNVRDKIEQVVQFSTITAECTLNDLIEGKLKTTGGTDFNCIIDHAVKHGVKKALIITDGYASVSKDRADLGKKNLEKVAVIYFGSSTRDNWFQQTYGVGMELEEASR